jgi:hypothetical protein
VGDSKENERLMATWSKLDLGCVRLNQALEPSGVDCTMSVQNCVMQAILCEQF